MFGRIARRYDLLNRVLSLGIDQAWRRATVRKAGNVEGQVGIDLCCGTGDLALAFEEAGASVVGLDFTPEMLPLARDKGAKHKGPVLFGRADALQVPARTNSAAFSSVAFGIRNVEDRGLCLREMARITRPGGRVLVLECSMPPGFLLGFLYRTYFTRVLPLIGRLVSKDDDAYSYLPRTVLAWPDPDTFLGEMKSAGLEDCGYVLLTRGITALHWGTVPDQ
jgi:demethylmenaquinone methyltransferase/2-methoxy-6-polyprenyl-1,4-benzoquinol methylase